MGLFPLIVPPVCVKVPTTLPTLVLVLLVILPALIVIVLLSSIIANPFLPLLLEIVPPRIFIMELSDIIAPSRYNLYGGTYENNCE